MVFYVGINTNRPFGLYEHDILSNKVSESYCKKIEDKNAPENATDEEKYTKEPYKTVYYTYDYLDGKTFYKSPQGYVTSCIYNLEGWFMQEIIPYNGSNKGKVEYAYDMLGNKTEEKVYTTNTSARTTGYVYDSRGNLIQTYTGNDKIVYEYDPAGNMTAQETGKNGEISRTEYEYDALDRLTKLTDSLGNSETYTYSGIYLTSQKDRNGVTTSYTYDTMGRVVNKNTGGKITSYTYGKTGALATQTNENATITNKYNAQGLVKAVRSDYDNRYNEIYYGYTDDGKMTSYTAYNNGSTMNGSFKFSYTPEGYLKEIMNDTVIKATYTYDKDANLTSAIYNGTNITKNYSYYENGALKNVTNKNGNTVVSQYTCEYQLDGNLSRVTDNVGGQKTYAYDSTGRLASETYKKGTLTEITSYTYDSRGNRLSAVYTSSQNPEDNYTKSYLYDTNNRLLNEEKLYTSGNANAELYRYYYDANGNQVRKVSNRLSTSIIRGNMSVGIYLASENSGYDVEKRTYDVYNRLTEVKKNNSTLGTYTYLPNDLRLSKTVGNNTTYFMWSGDDILAELNGSYAVTAQYVYGTERIYNCINNNYYLYNNHGDTSEVINMNGSVVKSYTLNGFDAYGDEKNPDSGDTNPFRYCGEYYDTETGNIYLRARYYDPSTGSFITEDPARDGVNWYGYCDGNPVMYIDPSGYEKGLARQFAYDIAPLFAVNDGEWDTSKNGIATLTLGWGNDTVVRDYNYASGMAYIPNDNSYKNIVGIDGQGHMEMERTDFYDSIGLNYVEYQVKFTVTKEGEIAQTVLYTAIGTSMGSKIPSTVLGKGIVATIGAVGGEIVLGEIQSGLILEEGTYLSEIILCDRPVDKNGETYENVQTTRVLRYSTDINTGESVPTEVISDYRTVYTGLTSGSEVNRIKNEI